jgi:hypothetical protein
MEKCLLGKDESILPQAREGWHLGRVVTRRNGWKDGFSAKMESILPQAQERRHRGENVTIVPVRKFSPPFKSREKVR